MALPLMVSVPTAAKSLVIDPGKVRGWIQTGELAAVNVASKPGGRPRWRIRQIDLALFLAGREAPARKAPVRARRSTSKNVIQFF